LLRDRSNKPHYAFCLSVCPCVCMSVCVSVCNSKSGRPRNVSALDRHNFIVCSRFGAGNTFQRICRLMRLSVFTCNVAFRRRKDVLKRLLHAIPHFAACSTLKWVYKTTGEDLRTNRQTDEKTDRRTDGRIQDVARQRRRGSNVQQRAGSCNNILLLY